MRRRVDPTTDRMIDDFLGPARLVEEREGLLASAFQQLSKVNETTKLKALASIVESFRVVGDDGVAPFVGILVTSVRQHCESGSAKVRQQHYELLGLLAQRGAPVKKELIPLLPSLIGPWLLGSHDMEPSVRQTATASLKAVFPTDEKRQQLIKNSQSHILSFVLDRLTVIIEGHSSKGLLDDGTDANANVMFAGLLLLGEMLHVSQDCHQAILDFFSNVKYGPKLLPQRPVPKNALLSRTPKVRSAVLRLLKEIVELCPMTTKRHQMVAQTVAASILDTDTFVCTYNWGLLLTWCKTHRKEALASMEPKFLDSVIDAFMSCEIPATLAIHFPMILPFVSVVSKSKAHREVVDEFCGALVQKASTLQETPNVSVDEMTACWSALTECWELHCVRKAETAEEADSLELFCVILNNLVTLCQQPQKERRYLNSLSAVIATSIGRAATRWTVEQTNQLWVPLLACISHHAELQKYSAVPSDDLALQTVLTHRVSPMLFGQLCAQFSSLAASSVLFLQRELHYVIALWCNNASPETNRAGEEDREAQHITALSMFLATAQRPFVLDDHMLSSITASIVRWHNAGHPQTESLLKQILALAPSRSAEAKLVEALNDAHSTAWLRLLRLTYVVDNSMLAEELLRSCRSAHDTEEMRLLARRAREDPTVHVEPSALVDALTEGATASLALWTRDTLSRRTTQLHGDNASDDEEEGSAPSSSESDDEDRQSVGGDGSESSAGSESSEANNELLTVDEHEKLLQWCEMLHASTDLGALINPSMKESPLLWSVILRALAALAPRLYPESLVSDHVLQEAIAEHQRAEEDESSSSDEDDEPHNSSFFEWIRQKKTSLKQGLYFEAVCCVKTLIESHLLNDQEDVIQRVSIALVEDILDKAPSRHDTSTAAMGVVSRLTDLVPFLSADAATSMFAEGEGLWRRHVTNGICGEVRQFEGVFRRGEMSDCRNVLTRAVRTAQLLKVIDTLKLSPSADVMLYMLKAIATQEQFSQTIRRFIEQKLSVTILKVFAADEELLNDVVVRCMSRPEYAHLVVTLATAVSDALATVPAGQQTSPLYTVIRRIATLVGQCCADRLLQKPAKSDRDDDDDEDGNVVVDYTNAGSMMYALTFFRLLDDIAERNREAFLCHFSGDTVPKLLELLLRSTQLSEGLALAICLHTHASTKVSLQVHHLEKVFGLCKAQPQSPDALLLVSALLCSRVLDVHAYSEICRLANILLTNQYALHHLPSNGRLGQRPPNSAGAAQIPTRKLQHVMEGAVAVFRGLAMHSQEEPLVRSTAFYVMVDIVCESVLRLRNATTASIDSIVLLAASASHAMHQISPGDVSGIRSSERCIAVVAECTCFLYAWCGTVKSSRLDAIGAGNVQRLVSAVCNVAQLMLVASPLPLPDIVRTTILQYSTVEDAIPSSDGGAPKKTAVRVKPLRAASEMSSIEPCRTQNFRRYHKLLMQASRQKWLAQLSILAFSLAATNESRTKPFSDRKDAREFRTRIFEVLDLCLSLSLTPTEAGAKKLEETLLASGVNVGHDIRALCYEPRRLDTTWDQMHYLGQGALSLVSLLLRPATLPIVKDWLATIEVPLRSPFAQFVTEHVSPVLIAKNLSDVAAHSTNGTTQFTVDDLTVSVNFSSKFVEATFAAVDDTTIRIKINLPRNYPLQSAEISPDVLRGVNVQGVRGEKWKAWMMKMSVMLFDGSNSLWDCIQLFGENVKRHFDGVEPCVICYAVVSADNNRLPDESCAVCRNSKFHSACLHKWWGESGQASCPLCRSPWVSR